MKTSLLKSAILGTAILCFLLVSCSNPLPDLSVRNSEMRVTWNETTKQTIAVVRNLGNATAYNFRVYVDYREFPVSQNYLPQNTFGPFDLRASDSLTIVANAQPLARPENNYLRNVRTVIVRADPKLMVEESNEYNNVDSLRVPSF